MKARKTSFIGKIMIAIRNIAAYPTFVCQKFDEC